MIKNAADLYAFAQLVNAGNYGASAVVTADIDYTAYGTKGDGLIGGTEDKTAFTGSFDAQNHKITIATNLDRNTCGRGEGMGGLFGRIGEGSKISNLWLDGTLTGNGRRMSGLCQNAFGTTLTNILVSVDIISTWANQDSDLASGGILGQAEKTNYLKNVVFAGSFKCKDTGGNGSNEWFAGMLGWVENGQTTMENCAAIIHSVEQDAQSAFKSQSPDGKQKNSPMSRHDEGLVIAKNCFYQLPPQWTTEWEHYKDYFVDNNDDKSIWQETVLTKEQVMSGELCYKMNQYLGDNQFTQDIDIDYFVIPFPCHDNVYFTDGSYTNYNGVYYIDTPQKLNLFAHRVNAGNYGLNAVITADIDYTAYGTDGNGIIGGTEDKTAYTGSFDAQGHKITIATNLDRNTCGRGEGMGGLFGRIGEGSKISNLWLDGSVTGNGRRMSGLCQNAFGTTLTNILVSVNIISTWANQDSDLASGGILGQAEKTNYLKNVAFVGSFKCKDTGGNGSNEWFAGMLGWVENGSTTMENCIAIINSVEQDAQSAFKSQSPDGKQKNSPMSRHDEGLVIAKNCYYQLPPQWTTEWEHYKDYFVDNGDDPSIWDEHAVESSVVQSGELCFKLNGDQTEIGYWQTIGEDFYPTPIEEENGQVYLKDGVYTNSDVDIIRTAADLYAFAKAVNAGDYGRNGKVVADIDYTAYGTYGDALIGGTEDKTAYTGTFDAQNHKITIATNLDRNTCGRGEGMGGLFGRIGEGSMISNLWLDGTLTGNGHRMSGLCQNAFGTNLQNILVSVDIISTWANHDSDLASGGILGQAEKTNYLKNVVFAGSFKCKDNGGNGSNEWFAGMLGWVENGQTTMENCAAIIQSVEQDAQSAFKSQSPDGKQKNSPMSRHDEGLVIAKNCYYQLPPQWTTEWEHYKDYFVDNNDDKAIWDETAITSEQVKSGELTFRLNGNQNNIVFYQTIGTDNYPVISPTGHKQVYGKGNISCSGELKGGNSFSNNAPNEMDPHNFVDGKCTVCGTLSSESELTMDQDGYYVITDQYLMQKAIDKVNAGATNINFKLGADVDFTDEEYVLSSFSSFAGIFDGQYHTLKVNMKKASASLFGTLNGTVRNLIVTGVMVNTGEKAGVITATPGNCTIENVVSDVEFHAHYNGTNGDSSMGGFIGDGGERTINLTNCVFTGHIIQDKVENSTYAEDPNNDWYDFSAIAGLMGRASSGTNNIRNCIVAGEVASYFGPCHPQSGNRGGQTVEYQKSSSFVGVKRGTANVLNLFATVDYTGDLEWGKMISTEETASGSVCYTLNGGSFDEPVWRQNIGEDEIPMPNPNKGIVYRLDYNNSYMDVHDIASMQAFQPEMQADESDWFGSATASLAELEGYEELIEATANAETLEDFKAAYKAMKDKRTAITENVSAYDSYIALAEEAIKYMEENELVGDDAEVLRAYLNDEVEAGDQFPNGSYPVIIADCPLTTQGIKDEKDYLSSLYRKAIGNGYQAGSDITILITNADFSNGRSGWNGKSATGAANIQGAMPIVETWRNTSDMNQTLTGLKNGFYELQVNAFTRTAGNDDARFYTAYAYANEVSVPIMNLQEDLISFNDAVDQQNCYVANAGTYPYDAIYNDSYFYPNSYTGAAYAFKGGRFVNNVVVEVTDGTLKIGVRQEGSGYDYDWLVCGNVKLCYRGELTNTSTSLDETLNDDMNRATTVLNADVSGQMSSNVTPSFYNGLRTELEEAINAASNASSEAEKYTIVKNFSNLFAQLKTCQLAYITVLDKIESRLNEIADKHEKGEYTDEDYAAVVAEVEAAENSYWSGDFTTAEALALSWKVVGIDAINAQTEEAPVIYDLTGRRVEKARKGLYIINGKKVLVK
ncbi:MAG: hypothetical protein IJR87_00460 [Bacteroidaceae bacterium]|nr:hypothetical protein [Bacteroidaceae bacterium]